MRRLAAVVLIALAGCTDDPASPPYARGGQSVTGQRFMLRPDEASDVVAVLERHATERRWTPPEPPHQVAAPDAAPSVAARHAAPSPADDPAVQLKAEVDRAHFTDALEHALHAPDRGTPRTP